MGNASRPCLSDGEKIFHLHSLMEEFTAANRGSMPIAISEPGRSYSIGHAQTR
jgi:hypothetical protein